MTYAPSSSISSSEFRFKVNDLPYEMCCKLYILDEKNYAPTLSNVPKTALEVSTYKDVTCFGTLPCYDPDGDETYIEIVSYPEKGLLILEDKEVGSYRYIPYDGSTGKDSFTYVAVDSVGNVSEEATVKVTISKPNTKVTYADMDGHPAYCSALRLAEEGVLIGEQMDGAYYFQPELPVSREQFVAMAMSAAGLDSLSGVGITGFSDDQAIPTWAKGYVSSALRSGILTGMKDPEGSICFNSGAAVTKAEATVILDRILNVSDVPDLAVLAEASIPTWASQSAANMSAVSVLSGFDSMDEGINRAQAADMLCAMLDVLQAREQGWA